MYIQETTLYKCVKGGTFPAWGKIIYIQDRRPPFPPPPSLLSFFIFPATPIERRNGDLLGGAVEGQAVGGALGDVGEDVGLGELLDAVAELVGGDVALEGEEVGADAGDDGAGAGGAAGGGLFERGTVSGCALTYDWRRRGNGVGE